MRVFLQSTALLLLALSLLGCHDSNSQPASTVTVYGSASTQATPDEFIIHAAATQEGKQIDSISQQVNQQVNHVIALLDKLDINTKQLQALNLQISPVWQYKPKRKLTGYQAKRNLNITTHGIDQYTKVMKGLVDMGINNIGRTQARVSNSHDIQMKLLGAAVTDARQRADKLAEAANLKVKNAKTIDTVGSSRPAPITMARLSAKASAPSFTPGQTTLSQKVKVTFTMQ